MADWQTAGLIGGIGCLVLVLSGLVARRIPLGQAAKMALAWVAIFLVAALIVGQRDQFARIWNDAFGGNQQVHGTAMRIQMSEDGHFWADAQVNGRGVRFMIDSGATTTTLSEAAARGAGIEPSDNFGVMVDTANGTVVMQRGSIARFRLGPIEREALAAHIAPNDMVNVIGMNLLSSLRGWGVEGDTLVLRP